MDGRTSVAATYSLIPDELRCRIKVRLVLDCAISFRTGAPTRHNGPAVKAVAAITTYVFRQIALVGRGKATSVRFVPQANPNHKQESLHMYPGNWAILLKKRRVLNASHLLPEVRATGRTLLNELHNIGSRKGQHKG